MQGDFSRLTFRPEHHFSGVLLQQGRVLLDSEFNEQVAIDAHRDRAMTRDVIGRAGAPIDGGGFAITVASMLRGVAAGDDVWSVGEDATLLRSIGGTDRWTIEPVPAGTPRLNAVDVRQASGWAVGEAATILRLSGTVWSAEPAGAGIDADLHGVHTDGAGGWAVGTGGTVLSWNGVTWERQAADADVAATLRDVHIVGDAGVAVGDAGTILTTSDRGAHWVVQSAPAGTGDLHAVFLADAQHGWAVGAQGTVVVFDGTTWTHQPVSTPVTTTLRAVMFTSATDGIAVGDDGTVLVFDSGGWHRESTGVDADLFGVTVLPGGALLVVGDDVTLTRAAPGQAWQPTPEMPGDAAGPRGRTLAISAGDMYVEGVRYENEHAVAFGRQPEPALDPAAFPPSAPGAYGMFLRVQEHHVTATEREHLREVALGGADSATRTRAVWQAGLVGLGAAGATCADAAKRLPDDRPRGRLRARALPAAVTTNDCIVPPNGGYRRLENQLYRVQIHDGTTAGAARYTWSRENGSVIARLQGLTTDAATGTVDAEVSHTGRDATLGFGPEQLVELTDEGRQLRGEPGVLAEIDHIVGTTLVLINVGSASLGMADFPVNPIVRRWDGAGTVAFDGWIELEDGVFVEFTPGPDLADSFRTGDHWTIPARTLSGGVEWPQEGGAPRFEERHGPLRHTVSLATAELGADGVWSGVRDCRKQFPPLTDLVRLSYVGGDGQEIHPPMPPAATNLVALDRPLEVALANGSTPMVGAIVDFTIQPGLGAGKVAAPGAAPADTAAITTDATGVASCTWQLDGSTPTQVVEARFRDPLGQSPPQMIRFTAQLSVAARVAYDGTICDRFDSLQTVQQAIDTLVTLPRLHHRGGDGSHAAPGDAVELRAGVSSDCGPDLEPRPVRFEVVDGDGVLEGLGAGETAMTAGGTVSCTFRMGGKRQHRIEARLIGADGASVEPPVTFTISRVLASEVLYEPGCDLLRLSGVDNVQDALTELCKRIEAGGSPSVEAAHVKDIQLLQSRRSIELGAQVNVDELASEGLLVVCDREMSGFSLGGINPPLRLTIDLPYPMSAADRDLWGTDVPFGVQPLVLSAGTDNITDGLMWIAQDSAKEWLTGTLFEVLARFEVRSVIARLQLLGNFIVARQVDGADEFVHLDAELFGNPQRGLVYPSGNGIRGGIGDMWFRLTKG